MTGEGKPSEASGEKSIPEGLSPREGSSWYLDLRTEVKDSQRGGARTPQVKLEE